MLTLIDTHAHLFWDSFKEDFDEVLQRALDAGVQTFINVGVDVHLSAVAARMETDKGKFYSSIGLHPEEALKYFTDDPEGDLQKDIAALETIQREYPEKVIAIGECGLDYTYFKRENYLPEHLNPEKAKDLQLMLFKAQIELAKKLNLPLLLHVRDDRSENPDNTECWDEVIKLTNDHFGIYHCYSGLPVTTSNLSPNFLVSFAGNITYKNNKYLQDAIKIVPLNRLCLETDCPFLPPQSIRGQRNEPSSVKEIAEMIADLKDISIEDVANQTTTNVKKLLKIT